MHNPPELIRQKRAIHGKIRQKIAAHFSLTGRTSVLRVICKRLFFEVNKEDGNGVNEEVCDFLGAIRVNTKPVVTRVHSDAAINSST
jgi:hypothetical protein